MPCYPKKLVSQHVPIKFKSYNIPSKVAQSAKLLGITGSPAQRKNIAAEMYDNFFSELDKISHERHLLGQPTATLFTDIQAQLKKMVPSIKVQLNALEGDKNPKVRLDDKYIKDVVDSYIISTDFDRAAFGLHIKRSDSSQNNSLHHEMGHFLNFITEPKIVARFYPSKMGSLNRFFALDFYESKLYTSNPIVKDFNIAEKIKFHSDLDKNKAVEDLEKEIKEFIMYSFFSPADKIDILQKWRYILGSEQDAYKLGAAESANRDLPLYESLLVLLRGGDVEYLKFDEKGNHQRLSTSSCKSFNGKGALINEERKKLTKFYAQYYNDCVFQFPEKIKAIENVLKEELFKQRLDHKLSLDKKSAQQLLEKNNTAALNQAPNLPKKKKSWLGRLFKD